jgi:hypothetical protein
MMQMRQKNLLVILVLPTFFLLDKYAAIFRTRALIHVYENKGIRGYFRVYNYKKKIYLYLFGKQTYSYGGSKGTKHFITTNFKGRFYGVFALGDESMEERYRAKKSKALEDTQKNPTSTGQIKYKDQRDRMLFLFRKYTKKTYQEIEEILLDYDVDMSFVQISNLCRKFGDSDKIDERKEVLKLKREKRELEKKISEPKDVEYENSLKLLKQEEEEDIKTETDEEILKKMFEDSDDD